MTGRQGLRETVAAALEHGWETVDTAPDSVVLTHATLDLTPAGATGAHEGRAFAVSRLYLTLWCPDGATTGVLLAGPAYPWEPAVARRISPRRAELMIRDLGGPTMRMHAHDRYRPRRTVFSQPLFWGLVLVASAAAAAWKGI
jgi:hypothetical protein